MPWLLGERWLSEGLSYLNEDIDIYTIVEMTPVFFAPRILW